MKIATWNVNGIRAVLGKGFLDWLQSESPDICCLQEVKAFEDQFDTSLVSSLGYKVVWHAGKTPGYAGVATLVKQIPVNVTVLFDIPAFHEDGRVVETEFADFTLLNIYFPNGGTRSDGTEMLSYKLQFYKDFLAYINTLRYQGKNVIVCGDFNICHTELDIARPKENENSIGFLPIEREQINTIVQHGYTDVFRYFYKDARDAYTWWSYRAGARPKNVGWRLDYFFVNNDLLSRLESFQHQTHVFGSDHCPVMLTMKKA